LRPKTAKWISILSVDAGCPHGKIIAVPVAGPLEYVHEVAKSHF
jgi:hypothetical protein